MPEKLKGHKFYRPKDSIEAIDVSEEVACARVAKWWNKLPWEFRAFSQDQRAELHAIHDIERMIEHYYSSEQCRKSDSKMSEVKK